MRRILITATALAVLAVAFWASTTSSLTARLDHAESDLLKTHAPIPHQKLHDRALEILREMEAK